MSRVLEGSGEGHQASGLPADLVLEQDTEHKQQLYENEPYTVRLLIFHPQGTKAGSLGKEIRR